MNRYIVVLALVVLALGIWRWASRSGMRAAREELKSFLSSRAVREIYVDYGPRGPVITVHLALERLSFVEGDWPAHVQQRGWMSKHTFRNLVAALESLEGSGKGIVSESWAWSRFRSGFKLSYHS